MCWVFLIVMMVSLVVPSGAGEPLVAGHDTRPQPRHLPRDNFYCQEPEYAMVYQMSSGFDAEIADDIPAELAGQVIGELTLWVGEWDAPWQDPLGVQVNFYHEACPPTLEPAISFTIPWAAWTTDLVYDGIAQVHRSTAPLPEPVTITEGMSLGVTALIDWGTASPFTGFCATPMHVSYGACVAYLDATNWGYDRWTAIDFYTTIAQDLAFCLGGVVTGAPEWPPAVERLHLAASPNPCNPRTVLAFMLESRGHVHLRIFDLSGRLIDSLLDETCDPGAHQVTWQGRDGAGRELASGLYIARLEIGSAGGQTVATEVKLVLVR